MRHRGLRSVKSQITNRKVQMRGQRGYMLITLMLLFTLIAIAALAVLPAVHQQWQRDREDELRHRGTMYMRAIQHYYRKLGRYPNSIDDLENSNHIRYLRKRYKDPITGQDDWKPIHFGQNKTPTAMGFFGQPLAGSASTLAGTGPSGGAGLPEHQIVTAAHSAAAHLAPARYSAHPTLATLNRPQLAGPAQPTAPAGLAAPLDRPVALPQVRPPRASRATPQALTLPPPAKPSAARASSASLPPAPKPRS